jgi:hypothetical protein
MRAQLIWSVKVIEALVSRFLGTYCASNVGSLWNLLPAKYTNHCCSGLLKMSTKKNQCNLKVYYKDLKCQFPSTARNFYFFYLCTVCLISLHFILGQSNTLTNNNKIFWDTYVSGIVGLYRDVPGCSQRNGIPGVQELYSPWFGSQVSVSLLNCNDLDFSILIWCEYRITVPN